MLHTGSLGSGKQSKKLARRFATSRATPPTSTPSRCPTANSNRCCARPLDAPFATSTERSARLCCCSVLANVEITSDMPATCPYEREPLLAPQHETLDRAALFPADAFELRLGVLGFREPEAEIADQAPTLRHVEDRPDAGRIEDRDPAHADAFGTRRN